MRDTNWGIPRTIEQTEGETKGVGGPGRPPPPQYIQFRLSAPPPPPPVDFSFLCVYYWGVGGRCSCWVALGCLAGRSRSDVEVVESRVA